MPAEATPGRSRCSRDEVGARGLFQAGAAQGNAFVTRQFGDLFGGGGKIIATSAAWPNLRPSVSLGPECIGAEIYRAAIASISSRDENALR